MNFQLLVFALLVFQKPCEPKTRGEEGVKICMGLMMNCQQDMKIFTPALDNFV